MSDQDITYELGNGTDLRIYADGGACLFNSDNVIGLNERQFARLREILDSVPKKGHLA
jgi:hypothetical protein